MYPTPPLTYYYPIPTTTPTSTPTPPLTYYHGHPQHFWKGGARIGPFDSQILLWGCCPLSADSARGGGGGGGGGMHMFLVILNTLIFHYKWGHMVPPPLGTPMTYYPYSSLYLLLPLLLPYLLLLLPLLLPLSTIPLVHGVG